MKSLGLIAAALLGLYGAIQDVYPTYSYRYRLTIAIEIDGKVHSGSSVIEVIWRGQPDFPGAGSFTPHVRGQAVYVDLESHGAIVATLSNFESYGPAQDGALSVLWLVPRAFLGRPMSSDDLPELPKLRGRRELTSNNMPRLIWFSDIANPKTARRITAAEIPTVFGPSARLRTAEVEITDAPIVVDIDKKLPWFGILEKPLGRIEVSYGFILDKWAFIGGAT
jgi:hypothetical protein